LKVLITQRVDYIKDYGEYRDSIDQSLIDWIITCGYLPIPVPNKLGNEKFLKNNQKNKQPILHKWISGISPNAIIISGGNDIGEYPQRDSVEYFLLDYAKIKNIPVLGICRGMQIMATWAGAKLFRVDNHVNVRHRLISQLKKEKFPIEVNSYHNWNINTCPKEFEITTLSEDGSIKSIKHQNLAWEGWNWHPEREKEINCIDTKRLMNLFN
tara:strand:+ start:15187 stop:15822 length:636 start_codon:yes stop_codon:yes gene_type:complete